MVDKNKTNRYLILHTHFYQPFRVNPFTGEIDLDLTSKPYDNWNHRIAMECYFPNLFSRIFDEKGNILEIINNYEFLSFNYGPTILDWVELYYPTYYNFIIQTVKNIKNQKGFSPAIAQSYNHTILPLDNFMNRMIQIQWGISDFKNRFGFNPEGIWIGELAVNEDILRLLIDNKISWIILSPHQISKAIEIKTQKEFSPQPNMLYVWFDRDEKNKKICSRHIKILTYDDELSRKVAFDNITFNSEIFSNEIKNRFNQINQDLILIASDGETYGHHHKFADLTLAHLFKYELKKHNIIPITPSQYILTHSPLFEAEIQKGPDGDGTSWSCSHGIRRWKGGCPCGDEGRYDTSWRFALRASVKWMSEVVGDIYRQEAGKIFKEPLNAILDYINIINKKTSINEFLQKHLIEYTPEKKEKAIKILMMYKYQMLSNTSCAWFFNDISRIESQLNLRNAYKAILITKEFGYKGVEEGFDALIEMAKSNFKEIDNGRKLLEHHIKPDNISNNYVYSYLILKTLFLNQKIYENFLYKIEINNIKETNEIEIDATINEKELDRVINLKITFNLLDISQSILRIKYNNESVDLKFTDFPDKTKLEILKYLITYKKNKKIDNLVDMFYDLSKAVKLNKDIVFENIQSDIEYISNQIINIYLIRHLKSGNIKDIEKINELIIFLKDINFKINFPKTNDIFILMPFYIRKLNDKNKEELNIIKNLFKSLNLYEFAFHIENILFTKLV